MVDADAAVMNGESGGKGDGGELAVAPPGSDAVVPPAPLSKIRKIKHPLKCRWTLFYKENNRNKSWTECMVEVTTFDAVEDFWALYNHIQLASGLPFSSDYYLFKQGIQPMWEDDMNREGGRWLIHIDKPRRHMLDQIWRDMLMAVIGEQFTEDSDQICGCVFNSRQKGDKISLWTKDGKDEEAIRRIGLTLKARVGLTEMLNYEKHSDTQQKTGSLVKPLMRV